MSLRNPFRQLMDLLPSRPLQVGTVTAVDGGVARITLPGGGILQARGEATVGQRVFVRDGLIESEATTLIYVEGEA